MDFTNSHGHLTYEEFFGYMDAVLLAKQALEKMFTASNTICHEHYNDFENKFDNFKKLINEYKDKPNNFRLPIRYDWAKIKNFDSNTETVCDTVGDLAQYFVEEVDKERNALLRKEKEVVKWKDKPVSKSIDKNTLWTAVLGLGAISAAFLTECFNKTGNGITGLGVFVLMLIVLCYKRNLFGEIDK